MFTEGRIVVLLFLIVIAASMYYYIRRAQSGDIPDVRPIPGLDVLREVVGRATEMGRPVFMTPGGGDVTDASSVETLAGLAILDEVASLTAEYDIPLRVTVRRPNIFPIAQEIVQQSYLRAGKPEAVTDEMVQFLSDVQFAWASGTLSIIRREKCAVAIMTGFFQAESLLLAEGSNQVGAVVLSGSARLYQIPFFVAASDYTLIGEELLVAGAYLSENPVQLGSLAGQDVAKVLSATLLLIGAVLATVGSDALRVLLDL
ncbi:MAG: DUF6754 domain-containing protein [Bacillota bacterium]